MKKLFWACSVIVVFGSCEKESCISCISESNTGIIVKYSGTCNSNMGFLEGYAEGLRKFYRENGDTVTVRCLYQ